MKKYSILFILLFFTIVSLKAKTNIIGNIPSDVSIDRMYYFVKSQNPSFEREIAENFYNVGKRYGVRGDIAICQSILETGWFKYKGSAVTPDQHNYCGMGVTSNGMKGNSFATIKGGVTAQIQHLYAYACTESLPYGEELIDPRFKYVNRGCAPAWEDLGGKWATGDKNYGNKILSMYQDMMNYTMPLDLTASQTNVTISGIKGETEPYTDVTITGNGLSSVISVNSSSSAFNFKKLNWDNYKGGTLRIVLNTKLEIGTYTGYIHLKSGSKSIKINLTGYVQNQPLSFKEGWNSSEINNSVQKFGWDARNVRNMTYANGKLYLVYNTSSIKAVNAQNGKDLGDLDMTGVQGGTLAICDVTTAENGLLACNLATSKSPVLKVYYWSKDNQKPIVLLETSNLGEAARLGDCIGFYGNLTSGKIVFGNDDNTTTRIIVYEVKNGVASKNPQVVRVTDGSKRIAVGSSMRVIPQSNGYKIDGKGCLPFYTNLQGVKTNGFIGENITWGNDFNAFTFENRQYALVTTYQTPDGTNEGNYIKGRMRLFDCNEGFEKATVLADYPTNGLGTTRNLNCTGSLPINIGSDFAEAWILVSGQGIAYYKHGNVPTLSPKPIQPAEPETPQISVSASEVNLEVDSWQETHEDIIVYGVSLTHDIKLNLTGQDAVYFSVYPQTISKDATATTVTINYKPMEIKASHIANLNISSDGAESITVSLNGISKHPMEGDPFIKDMETKWLYSQNRDNLKDAPWFNSTQPLSRDMGLNNGKLYIINSQPNNDADVVIINAYTGTQIGSLDITGIVGGENKIASIKSIGGKVIASNAVNEKDELKVYIWDNDKAQPSLWFKDANHAGIKAGRIMSVYGNMSEGKIMFGSHDKIIMYDVVSGIVNTTPQVISLTKDGKAYSISDSFSSVDITLNDDGSFWANGKAQYPTLFDANGNYIESFTRNEIGGGSLSSGSAARIFDFGKRKYIASITYLAQTNTLTEGALSVYDMTDGINSVGVTPQIYPKNGFGKERNIQFVDAICQEVKDGGVNIWALVPTQGIGLFHYKGLKPSGINSNIIDNLEIIQTTASIKVIGTEIERIDLYNISGLCVESIDNSNEISTNHLSKGVYIISIKETNGLVHNEKIIIR